MNHPAFRSTARAAGLVLAALVASSDRAAHAQQFNRITREVKYEQKLDGQVPLDLHFQDSGGSDVRLGDLIRDKPVVLSLVYYECPMLCTISLNGLAAALKVLSFVPGQEFEVVTVSFDASEKPALAAAKKKAYLSSYGRQGAAAGWHFLTGKQASIDALTRAAGFRYVWDEATKQYAHPAGVMVLTPEGRISHYLFGVEYAPKDLRLALVAAASGRIGNLADELLLYCYQYDPRSGRYSASILNLVRGLGVLTVLGLVGFMLTASRRPKTRSQTRPAGAPGDR